MISSRLLLIGASGLATQALPPTAIPNEYSFLYTASAPSCRALAARTGDRLWLTPRPHPELDTPDSWTALLEAHRYHGVIAVVPAGALADGVASLRAAGTFELCFDREWRTLELALRPEQP